MSRMLQASLWNPRCKRKNRYVNKTIDGSPFEAKGNQCIDELSFDQNSKKIIFDLGIVTMYVSTTYEKQSPNNNLIFPKKKKKKNKPTFQITIIPRVKNHSFP